MFVRVSLNDQFRSLCSFFIYINDIVADINGSIKLFADDTSLYMIVDDPVDAADSLNTDLAKIHEWSMKWLVKFNSDNTESMIVSRKSNRPFHPPLMMDNKIINMVSEHKHLRLTISNDGHWGKHVDLINTKAFTRVNIMRKFKFILDRRTLDKIYLTFIRHLLEYGNVVWDFKTVYLTNKLESAQAEAANVVAGGTRLVSLSKLYGETGWEYLKIRREKHRLTYFYKMNNGLTPGYLKPSEIFTITIQDIQH
jgi:hypothetical protein